MTLNNHRILFENQVFNIVTGFFSLFSNRDGDQCLKFELGCKYSIFSLFPLRRPSITFGNYGKLYTHRHSENNLVNLATQIWMDRSVRWTLKDARSDCFIFCSDFRGFRYPKKAHIFLITLGEFYSWKMYRLEDHMKMWLVMVTIKLTQ